VAASASLKQLNPQVLWLVMIALGVLILVGGTAAGIFLGVKENQSLVRDENRMILRRNGELLTHQNIRTFVESLGLDERDYALTIQSELDHQKINFGKLARSVLVQCSTEFYFQYEVELCRPPPISWPLIGFFFAAFAALVAGVSWIVRRLGLEMLASFKELFLVAKIQAPEDMKFNQAWTTAFSMAGNFSDFQNQLLAAEKNRAIVDISRQVAHDIRSPLTALNIFASTVKGLSDEHKQVAVQAIRRIDQIASDLLQKSKAQKGDHQLSDLNLLIKQVVSEKKLEYQNRPLIKIEYSNPAASEPMGAIDAAEFSRVISNLMNNSIEAIGVSEGETKVSLRVYENESEIFISDNGPGIAPEILDRLGERGFSHRKQGNGLGVYHAKSTIEEAGGKFSISSQLGVGTMVSLRLPKT